MKSRRRIYLAILTLLFIGTIYTGESIYQLGLFTMLFILLSAVCMNLLTVHYFTFTQQLSPSFATKGENVDFWVRIQNKLPFPLTCVKVFYNSPEEFYSGRESSTLLSLLPLQFTEIHHQIPCSYRGEYKITITRIEVMDIYGLFVFRKKMDYHPHQGNDQLMIYPKALLLDILPLSGHDISGLPNFSPYFSEGSASPYDIHTYRYGDALKRVHWKLSFRKQELLIKDYEESSKPITLVFLDCAFHPYKGMEKVQIEDMMIECAMSVVYSVLYKSLCVELMLYSGENLNRIGGKDHRDLPIFYEILAKVSFKSQITLEGILQHDIRLMQNAFSIYLITHKFPEKSIEKLIALQNTGILITLIILTHRKTISPTIQYQLHILQQNGIHALLMTPSDHFIERMRVPS